MSASTVVAGLPTGFTARRPDAVADVDAVFAVCASDDAEVLGHSDVSRAEVVALLTAPLSAVDADQWVVEDAAGTVVAYGQVTADYAGEEDQLEAYVTAGQPAQVRAALFDALLARAAERAEAEHPQGSQRKVWLGLLLDDARWEALAASRGLAPERLFARMRRPLDDTLPPPVVPPGISVRTFDDSNAEDWRDFHRVYVTAFLDHWEGHETPYDAWRARIDGGDPQRFDRWWLADDAALGPVGMCQGTQQYVEEGGGWVRNLGVLREARGRGVARCLLLTAMAAFRSDGLAWCGLGVDTASTTGALHLYESVGMVPTWRARMWGRPVRS